MLRRLAIVIPRIPLFLIVAVISREVKETDEELVRIAMKNAGRHYYNISVRTRSFNRELRARMPRAGYRKITGGGT